MIRHSMLMSLVKRLVNIYHPICRQWMDPTMLSPNLNDDLCRLSYCKMYKLKMINLSTCITDLVLKSERKTKAHQYNSPIR